MHNNILWSIVVFILALVSAIGGSIAETNHARQPYLYTEYSSDSGKSLTVDLIQSDSITVNALSQLFALKNFWSYLLYRWSIALYFVPLIVMVLCKCKVINCDVRLMYGSMPDE